MTEVQNDPDRVLHPLRRTRRRRLRAGLLGRGARRHRRAPAARSASATAATRSAGTWATPAPSPTRTRSGSRASSTRSARRTPTPPARRTSPTASPPAPSSTARRSSSRSPTSRAPTSCSSSAPTRSSRTAACSRAPRIKDQLHAITERGGRVVVVDPRRSETARAFEHVADRPRRRRLAAALAARGDLRRGARGRATRSRARRPASTRCAGWPPSTRPRRPRRAPASPRARGARARPRPRRPPSAPPSTGAPAPASAATGPWSPSCSTRSTWSPATSTARAGRCSATRRSTSPDRRPRRARDLRQGPLAGRRPARGARLAAGLGDGEGDHDARQGPDPGAVRLRRQPGALGPQRRRARGGDRASSTSWSRSTSTSTTPPATATSCSRRRRCTSARTSRCRSSALFTHPVHPDDRGGRRAARRGAPGVGGDRGDLAPDRRRPVERLAPPRLLGQGRDPLHAPAAGRPAAAHRARRATCSASAAAASASRSCARNPHGIVLAEHLAAGRDAQAAPPPRPAGAPRPAARSSRTPARLAAPQRRTTPTSRCG